VAEQAPGPLLQLRPTSPTRALPLLSPPPEERAQLERRARLLAWGGIVWHIVEFGIALGAGVAAGSIALIGFGADSLIESLAGVVVLWLFTGARIGSHGAERRAQQMISISFFVLAAYVSAEAIRTLIGGQHPETSWVGIGLAAFTAPTMPLLAIVKRRVANGLQSAAASQGGFADSALRLPLCRTSRRLARERAGRMVVGRSRRGSGHRSRRAQGRTRKLARGRLLRRLLTMSAATAHMPDIPTRARKTPTRSGSRSPLA